MIPMGTKLRYCSVCGYPIHAKSDELTVHEIKCIEEMLVRAGNYIPPTLDQSPSSPPPKPRK